MRKCSLILGSVVTLFASVAQANFIFTTSRSVIATGTFAGDDGVTLSVQNDGTGGTGSDILFYDVNLAATVGTANPQFFIRTWNGTIRNTSSPSSNTQADFGYQGFAPGDVNRNGAVDIFDLNLLLPHFNTTSGNTWETGDFNGDGKTDIFDLNTLLPNFNKPAVTPGSYVRFGSAAQFNSFFVLGTTPGESSQVFTDGQAVTGFELANLNLGASSGLPDSVATPLAFAVVPTGQGVVFSGTVGSQTSGSNPTPFTITAAGAGLSGSATAALVPEPASLGLLSLAGLMLCRSRRERRVG